MSSQFAAFSPLSGTATPPLGAIRKVLFKNTRAWCGEMNIVEDSLVATNGISKVSSRDASIAPTAHSTEATAGKTIVIRAVQVAYWLLEWMLDVHASNRCLSTKVHYPSNSMAPRHTTHYQPIIRLPVPTLVVIMIALVVVLPARPKRSGGGQTLRSHRGECPYCKR